MIRLRSSSGLAATLRNPKLWASILLLHMFACTGPDKSRDPDPQPSATSPQGNSTQGESPAEQSGAKGGAHAKQEARPKTAKGDGPRSPSPHLPPRSLTPLGDGLRAYNPHRDFPHVYRGSGHTHAAPDHSEIPAPKQQRRLRDLSGEHAQDFAWMTAHDFVIPDPGVEQFVHLYGIEIYTDKLPSGEQPHVLALLPDDTLVDTEEMPFGRYKYVLGELSDRIHEAGGLAVLAHPTRYSPTVQEAVEVGESLWGIEGISRNTDVDKNLQYVDARLSAGKYTCISAGSDVHDEDWSLTMGYQMVASEQKPPTRKDLFEQVKACNFFACFVNDTEFDAIDAPSLQVDAEGVHFRVKEKVDRITFVGQTGMTLDVARNVREARYRPNGEEGYVRVEAYRKRGHARCLSQPVWLYSEPSSRPSGKGPPQ